MSSKLSITARSAPQCEPQGEQFKGLMALFAAIELAQVDLGRALFMHNPGTKDRNIEKAREALSAGLANFKRGNGL